MLKEGTRIALRSEELDRTVEFEVSHAENILNSTFNTPNQWALPVTSKYELKGGKINFKPSSGGTQSSKE